MTPRRLPILAVAAAAALVLAGIASGAWTCFTVKRTATLSGPAERPTAGDPDASGSVAIGLDVAEGLVCWSVNVRGVAAAITAHVHKGAAGVAGPAVVTFPVPPSGASKGCVSASRAVIRDIVRRPAQYYFNIHTREYPGGAARGQLRVA